MIIIFSPSCCSKLVWIS